MTDTRNLWELSLEADSAAKSVKFMGRAYANSVLYGADPRTIEDLRKRYHEAVDRYNEAVEKYNHEVKESRLTDDQKDARAKRMADRAAERAERAAAAKANRPA